METDAVNVASGFYRNYLRKADECFNSMNASFTNGDWNMAVIASVHCAISSADALTVKFLGIRHKGMRHEGVVKLLNELKLDDISKKNRQLLNLLSIKSAAEYEPRLMSQTEASEAVRDAERFYKWAKGVLKEQG